MDNLVMCITTDWCRCVADILFENARRLAVPFFFSLSFIEITHIYPRAGHCSCGNLICIVFAHFFPLKNVHFNCNWSIRMTNTNYSLAIFNGSMESDGRLKGSERKTMLWKYRAHNNGYGSVWIDSTEKITNRTHRTCWTGNWQSSRNKCTLHQTNWTIHRVN